MPRIAKRVDPDFELLSIQQRPTKGTYKYIRYKTRIRLIRLVFQEKLKIKSAAKSLGLKISTAKNILKSFCEKGKIHRKKQEKNKIFQEYLDQNQELTHKIISDKKEGQQKKTKRIHKEKKINQTQSLEQNIENKVANEVPNIKDSQISTEGQVQYFQIFYNMNMNLQYYIPNPAAQNMSIIGSPDFYLAHPYIL